MFHQLVTAWLRWWGGIPAFRVWGKARREREWRIVDVYATHRRNLDSAWPAFLFRGTCIDRLAQIDDRKLTVLHVWFV